MQTDKNFNLFFEDLCSKLIFNEQGLIPAIAQDSDNKDVLMMAWMNKDSIKATLLEQKAIYWSRSRGQLWRKGDTSGHSQDLVEFNFDCDGDTILLKVKQKGAACHTMRPNCFFYKVENQSIQITSEPIQ